MLPTLDLSRARHSKMMVAPPRLNLRKAASYKADVSGLATPLSATSSRFTFNYLLFSPPPSPSLPAPSGATTGPASAAAVRSRNRRHRRSFSSVAMLPPRPSRVVRVLLCMSGLLLVLYVASGIVGRLLGRPRQGSEMLSQIPYFDWWSRPPAESFEVVGQDDYPDFATPVAVKGRHGSVKWTVSIPHALGFPLSVADYAGMAAKCHEIASHVRETRHQGQLPRQVFFGDGFRDSNFVDVREAEKEGLLPKQNTVVARHPQDGDAQGPLSDKPICERSMTFVLESADAGLGHTLMVLWTAYGIAREEGRAFFVDDTRWAYGKYTSVFDGAAKPKNSCRQPPRHEMIPCPRQARHLVVTTASARDVFSSVFILHEHDEVARKRLFSLARAGYEGLFRLLPDDAAYVDRRVAELRRKVSGVESTAETSGNSKEQTKQEEDGVASAGVVVGLHIRRGDRHPLEFQYQDSYIPLTAYAEHAREVLNATVLTRQRRRLGKGNEDEDDGELELAVAAARNASLIVLASDDPTVYESDEFAPPKIRSVQPATGSAAPTVVRAQDRIRLASKTAIQKATSRSHGALMHRFVDDTFGWEGGFFAAMFWNLGKHTDSGVHHLPHPPPVHRDGKKQKQQAPRRQAAAPLQQQLQRHNADESQPPSPETLRLRALVGRAYLMDLAVLAGAGDAVVCAASATGCRLLAVMMGWERAGLGVSATSSLEDKDTRGGGNSGGWIDVDGGSRAAGWTGMAPW